MVSQAEQKRRGPVEPRLLLQRLYIRDVSPTAKHWRKNGYSIF